MEKTKIAMMLVVILIVAGYGGFYAGQTTFNPQSVTVTATSVVTKLFTFTETFTTTQLVTKTTIKTETLTVPKTLTITTTMTNTVTITTTMQKNVTKLKTIAKAEKLENPTWQELKEFLEQDDTDKLPYKPEEFDCTGYALILRDNARTRGFRCAYVEVEFANGKGHALNAFQTIDKGLVFVDVTESDKIAYVKIGKPYGLICLDGVKWKYIDCSLYKPEEFWGPLTYVECDESSNFPLSYDYYTKYVGRVMFYNKSVQAYNRAVNEYNIGSTKYTYEQLSNWRSNLEALKQDLGSVLYEPLGIVENIEIYWD